jgi:hypothetical protein
VFKGSKWKFNWGEVEYGWERYFATGQAGLTDEMITALICREFKWTYSEYEKQPSWFIDLIVQMMRAEARAINLQKK